jgi:hypothetical protein
MVARLGRRRHIRGPEPPDRLHVTAPQVPGNVPRATRTDIYRTARAIARARGDRDRWPDVHVWRVRAKRQISGIVFVGIMLFAAQFRVAT